jgi:hypothetical protein
VNGCIRPTLWTCGPFVLIAGVLASCTPHGTHEASRTVASEKATSLDAAVVKLESVDASALTDGRSADLSRSHLGISFTVTAPMAWKHLGVLERVRLTELRDANGVDLLKFAVSPDELNAVADFDLFGGTLVLRVGGNDVLQRRCLFGAQDIPFIPEGVSVVKGVAIVIRPESMRTFELPVAREASEPLRELVPGFWAAAFDPGDGDGWRLFYWLCNRAPAEFAGRPERGSWSAMKKAPMPGRNENEPARWIGHDPSKPPARVSISVIDPKGNVLARPAFGGNIYGTGSSGAYGLEQLGIWRADAAAVRVEIATQFETIEVPFEFRDIPLSTSQER